MYLGSEYSDRLQSLVLTDFTHCYYKIGGKKDLSIYKKVGKGEFDIAGHKFDPNANLNELTTKHYVL